MMLTIEEIKKTESDANISAPTLKAVVLSVSEIEKETSKSKSKFYAILADATGSISATVYDETQYNKFVKGFGVILINILLKQSYVGVTSRTEVAICKEFQIPDEVRATAPCLPGNQSKDLEMALGSPVKSIVSVKGKITQVSPATTKIVDKEEMAFQEIVLKDKSTKATVAIWKDMVNTFEKGQLVKLTKLRVRLFNDEKRMSTTTGSSSELFPHDDDLDDVSSDDDDDNIYSDEAAALHMNVGVIVGVFQVDPYLACPKPSCNNKKLITLREKDIEIYFMFCNTCQARYKTNSCNNYLRAVLLMESNDQQKKITAFLPHIKKLFECRGMEFQMSFDKSELMVSLMNIFPLEVKYTLNNNTLQSIACKRV